MADGRWPMADTDRMTKKKRSTYNIHNINCRKFEEDLRAYRQGARGVYMTFSICDVIRLTFRGNG